MSEASGTPPEQTPAQGRPRPSRYPRTANGLIGSLIVTLLFIGAFVALRELNSKDLEVKPTAVDYLASVGYAQDSGFDPAYPTALPKGWIATSVDFTPGDRPAWGIGMLTDDGKFAGIRQADESLDDLLHTYVDKDPAEGDKVDVTGSVAPSWRTFSDSGGDHAYAAELAGDTGRRGHDEAPHPARRRVRGGHAARLDHRAPPRRAG